MVAAGCVGSLLLLVGSACIVDRALPELPGFHLPCVCDGVEPQSENEEYAQAFLVSEACSFCRAEHEMARRGVWDGRA